MAVVVELQAVVQAVAAGANLAQEQLAALVRLTVEGHTALLLASKMVLVIRNLIGLDPVAAVVGLIAKIPTTLAILPKLVAWMGLFMAAGVVVSIHLLRQAAHLFGVAAAVALVPVLDRQALAGHHHLAARAVQAARP
jgi:hypothetical protein